MPERSYDVESRLTPLTTMLRESENDSVNQMAAREGLTRSNLVRSRLGLPLSLVPRRPPRGDRPSGGPEARD